MTTQNESAAERLSRLAAEKELAFQAKVEPWRQQAAARVEREKAERAAAETAKAERLAELQTAAFDRTHKTAASLAYRRAGGSPEEFEKKWPELRERLREELVLKQEAEPAPRRSSATF